MILFKRFFDSLSNNKRKILSNVAWALFGKVINSLGVFFVGILVARYLGPKEYGLMNYVISFVTLFTIVAEFGFGSITVRELAKNSFQKNEIMGTTFWMRMIFSLIAFILVVLIGIIYHSDKETIIMIIAYSSFLLTTPFTVIRNYFTSIMQNKCIVQSEISRTCIGAIIKIILLFFEMPLIYFICAAAFDFFLVTGGYIISYKKIDEKIHNWKFEIKFAKFLCSESWPLALSSSAIVVYQKIDQVMIKNIIDDVSVGYFATAAGFLSLILFLPGILAQTITPLLVKQKKENEDQYLANRQRFVNVMVWGTIIISVVISLTSYWIIKLTYGEAYLAAVPILQVLAWKTVGAAFSEASGHLIIIDGIQKWAFFRNFFGCIACVLLNVVFIPVWGAVGSAFVAVIVTLITGFLSLAIIPPYQEIFKVEIKAIFLGWKDLLEIRNMVKNNNR